MTTGDYLPYRDTTTGTSPGITYFQQPVYTTMATENKNRIWHYAATTETDGIVRVIDVGCTVADSAEDAIVKVAQVHSGVVGLKVKVKEF